MASQASGSVDTIVDGAPDAVVVIGADGNVLRWNGRAEALFGWPASVAVGRRLGDLIVPPGQRAAHVSGIERVVRTGESRLLGRRVELHALRRDGSEIPVELTLSRLDGDREPAFVGFIRDIRERQDVLTALRDAREVFRLAFHNAPIGMALVSPDGRWLQVNDAICSMTGYERETLLTKTFQDITHPDDLDADLDQVRRVLAGEIATYEMEKRYIRADGSVIWVLLSVSLVRDDAGEPHYFISQIQDISARKRSDVELRRSNAELQQFADAAAHDLAEPLRTIKGFADLLAARHADALGPEAGEFLEHISGGVQRMDELLHALLNYTRVGAQEPQWRPVDLDAVAHEALADLHATVRERDAVVTIGELPTVTGDPAQLRQVVHNLIANALKFTPQDRSPEVDVEASPVENGWQVSVSDRGIGLPSRSADRAFELFARLHPRNAYPGTGMGLALCKKVIERHGGTIGIERRPDGGTTVSFTLPVDRRQQQR
jgi:PAS domain S-box-containing protein